MAVILVGCFLLCHAVKLQVLCLPNNEKRWFHNRQYTPNRLRLGWRGKIFSTSSWVFDRSRFLILYLQLYSHYRGNHHSMWSSHSWQAEWTIRTLTLYDDCPAVPDGTTLVCADWLVWTLNSTTQAVESLDLGCFHLVDTGRRIWIVIYSYVFYRLKLCIFYIVIFSVLVGRLYGWRWRWGWILMLTTHISCLIPRFTVMGWCRL